MHILSYNSLSEDPLKGKVPDIITYNTTPNAQISAGAPLYSFFNTIYGAIKLGVPQNILTFLLLSIQVENPKSINLGSKVILSIRMLSNLISRWQIEV